MSTNALNRRTFLASLSAAGAAAAALPTAAAARTGGDHRPAYLGSFSWTDPPGRGFDVASHDLSSGQLRPIRSLEGVPDASWLAFSPDRHVLYTTNELVPDGTVTALSLWDPRHPRIINTRSSRGAGPTHLSVHPSGRFLLTANYTDGTVAVHRLEVDGGVGESTDLVRHTSEPRAPHAHQVITDPSGRWVVAVDLGADAVFTYRLDTASGELHRNQRLSAPTGSGPRHLAFHPDGRHAYLLNELASTVTVLRWDAAAGTFELGESVSTRPPDAAGENYPAEIVVTRDDDCYVTNRGDNTVAHFKVSDRGTRLHLTGTTDTGGDWPRHCTLDRTRRWLHVANQNSGTVTRFSRDCTTGSLSQVVDSVEVPGVAVVAL
ncbi:6-phosphogluconolactonase, cycloisomerase 2 family [Actinopolyspora lacussalsi subsp. righensis]|uniref:6-phosphogluconolactonase, cycloisomerase 2 family n=1 Tax=Actinopolyspora righensis TaxID=995060 RepID=A0A1I7BJP8_9ACTN|nr:lactonase family protein [Actinopolyspora righensis]SFT87414.1 6-phosphogluconolactonase, cycloisomerase 2 family [Actinopolyspora righensis]